MRAMQEPEREVHARGSGTRGGRKKMLLRGDPGQKVEGHTEVQQRRGRAVQQKECYTQGPEVDGRSSQAGRGAELEAMMMV